MIIVNSVEDDDEYEYESNDEQNIGETEDRLRVYLDKLASEADHIVLINRIKKHTEFEHEFESGLLKMMASVWANREVLPPITRPC